MELTLIAQLIAAAGAGGAVVWLLMDRRRLAERLAKLEQAKTEPDPAWGQSMRMDHRRQLADIATLSELALGDLLDATIRLSPEAARRAIEKHAPHLFNGKEVK